MKLHYYLSVILGLAPGARAAAPSNGIDLTTCELKESNYFIDLVDMSDNPISEDLTKAFSDAAARWQAVIIGDLPGYAAGSYDDWFGGQFSKKYAGAVDDVVIGYALEPIDGVGGTLGSAGAVYRRKSGDAKGTAVSGVMKFDLADFESMPIADARTIILHEMGHVLGLVGTSGDCASGCNPNNPSQQATYSCSLAKAEYADLNPGQTLFLENDGSVGTACSHWEENSFKTNKSSELMTGFFEANLYQPLSLVTIAALDDIVGYTVDYCAADIFPATDETANSGRFPVQKTDEDHDYNIENLSPIDIAEDAIKYIKNLWKKFLIWFKENRDLGIAIFAGGGALLLILFCTCCCCCRQRKERNAFGGSKYGRY